MNPGAWKLTAAQAAQKYRLDCGALDTQLTAAQAAQKSLFLTLLMIVELTAAQAAQKSKSRQAIINH